jgi:histidinol-phosphate aminotransferase
MRVGYGIFPDGLIKYLWRAKQPYNVSVAAEVAAVAALSNPAYLKDVRDKLVAERGNMTAMLASVSFLEPYPSHANFILCRCVSRSSTQAIQAWVLKCLQGGRTYSLAACGVGTIGFSSPALEAETLTVGLYRIGK